MSYLAFKCFDVSVDDSAIDDSILAGEYVLQAYAESQWLEHVKQCTQDMPDSSTTVDICQVLVDFLEQRVNPNFEPPLDTSKVSLHSFVYFQLFSFYDTLRWMSSFMQEKRQVVSVRNGPTWINDDPLLVSAASIRIWQRFDSLACPSRDHLKNSLQLKLVKRYGPHIFKCDRPPYDPQDLKSIFLDAIEADELICARKLLEKIPNPPLSRAMENAIRTSSVPAVRLLLEFGYVINTRGIITYNMKTYSKNLSLVIQSKEIEILRVLLEHWANSQNCTGWLYFDADEKSSLVNLAFVVRSPESMKLLMNYGADMKLQACYRQVIDQWKEMGPEEELVATQCIQILLEHTASESAQSELLLAISAGCKSIEIARYLLENKANINFICVGKGAHTSLTNGSTAIYLAAHHANKRSAEFLRFLLQSGADPTFQCKKLPGERPGARNISKYLGMTWDELCQSTSSLRKTVNPAVTSDVPAQSNIAVRSADDNRPVFGGLPLRPLEPFSMDSGNQSQQERPLGQEESSTSKRRRLA
ncbi:MAG: hypothetical protein Q9187_000915 [Circinaria calcarea]